MPPRDDKTENAAPGGVYPNYRSHYLPRSGRGWVAVILFLGLFSLSQPPFVYVFANRIEPWLFGVPFLYAYLLIVYFALIAVLIWARRQEL